MKNKLGVLLMLILTSFVLFACRSETIKVSFYSDDALYKVEEVQRGSIMKMPTRPSMENYVFIGWYEDKERTALFDENQIITESISLYGTYEKETKHVHSKIETIVEATCTEDGELKIHCETCKQALSKETIKAIGHKHSDDAEAIETVQSSCIEDGYQVYECENCHKQYRDNIVSKTGHFGVLISQKAATCTVPGVAYYECSVCEVEYQVTLEATGHTFTDHDPCSICGAPFYTSGLIFKLNTDKSAYVVSGYDGKIAQIYIPSFYEGLSVDGIAESAFFKKSIVSSISFPASIKYIGKNAFLGCTTISELDFSKASELETIGDYAFKNCSSLKTIKFNTKLTSIGAGAFSGCINISSLDLEATSLQTIKEEAFDGCIILSKILLPPTVFSIGKYAFRQCSDLLSMDLSSLKNLTAISDFAFYRCTSVVDISLPDNLESIGQYAFYNCSELKNIVIPSKIISIGLQAFNGCTKLEVADLTKATSLTTLGDKAFYLCNSLKEIVIPASVSKIGRDTLAGCESLETIYIESNEVSKVLSFTTTFMKYCKKLYVIEGISLSSYLEGHSYTIVQILHKQYKFFTF